MGLLITPGGLPYEKWAEDDLAFLRLDDGAPIGQRVPSTEWHFHIGIDRARYEFSAIVHTHAVAATAIACHRDIPPFHYMIAVAGGRDIRCARYAMFGTQALADHVLAALEGRKACLLANHGLIACEDSLAGALVTAIEVENLARTYLQARMLGEPTHLDDEMARVLEEFASYGRAA